MKGPKTSKRNAQLTFDEDEKIKKEGKATSPEFPLLTTILPAYIRKSTTTMMSLTLSKRYQKSHRMPAGTAWILSSYVKLVMIITLAAQE
jgi:hypothetical protein